MQKMTKNLEGKIPVCQQARHEYLSNYYGTGNTSEMDGNVYYYWNGEVAVMNQGLVKLKPYKLLLQFL